MPTRRKGIAGCERIDHYLKVDLTVRGATEKDVLEDPISGRMYIAKLGRRNNDLEVGTEYAIYLIGRTLGVPLANARIGRYKDQLRFMSEYFLGNTQELVHGFQLFKQLYDETTVVKVLKNQRLEQAIRPTSRCSTRS